MKVALCIPVYSDTVRRKFADSLAGLLLHVGREPFDGELLEVQHFIAPGLLPMSRNAAARSAFEWKADWILWLDSDQMFPPDTLHRLLAHGKKLVCANYMHRTKDRGVALIWVDGKAEPFHSSLDRPALEKVYLTGLGVTLTASEVVAAVAKLNEGPPFQFETDGSGQFAGEDFPFIHKAGTLGYECYVDNRLSMEVGHLSEVELKF